MEKSPETSQVELDSLGEEVVDLFAQHGNLTTGAILTRVDESRPTVLKRLRQLHYTGYMEYADEQTSLHRLIADPRTQPDDDE